MGVLMSMLFATLITEMVVLTALVLPLPLKLRKQSFKLYTRIYENRELRTIVAVVSVFVSLLFVDALKTMWKLKTNDTYDPAQYKSTYKQSSDVMARIFYSQRNVYISGAVMFIGVAIPTVFNIIKRLIKYEELSIEMKDPKKIEAKIDELKAQLVKKEKEVEGFEQQKKGLERSYDELADKVNAGTVSDKKRD